MIGSYQGLGHRMAESIDDQLYGLEATEVI